MSSNYQPWYGAFVEENDQTLRFNDNGNALLDGPGAINFAPSPLPYDVESSAGALWGSRLPRSIRLAVETPQPDPSLQYRVRNVCSTRAISAVDERNRGIATTPLSFAQRSLRYQHDVGALPSERVMSNSSYQKRDSGVGGLDDFIDFDGCGITMDDPSENVRFLQREECGGRPTPLQYHLIEQQALRVNLENAPLSPTPPMAPSFTVPPASNSDVPPLKCPVCTDKWFTGNWAHRNLVRHMERVHAPSPERVRLFPCGHDDCEKTFKREDARLIHERRSHPDLNRPPPTKRRSKSGELRA